MSRAVTSGAVTSGAVTSSAVTSAAVTSAAATSRAVTGSPATGAGTTILRVDPLRCDGIGMCAHAAPSLVALDSWGYPIVPRTGLSRPELSQATAAARACPRRALFLQQRP